MDVRMFQIIVYSIIFLIETVKCFPDPGQWSASYVNVPIVIRGFDKPLYSGSSIYISVNCDPYSAHQKIELKWVLRQTSCFEDYLVTDIYNPNVLNQYFTCPMSTNYAPKVRYFISKPVILECSNRIHLEFINVTFTTFSSKVEIPPECQGTVNTLASLSDSEQLKSGSESNGNYTLLREHRDVSEHLNSKKGKISTVSIASMATSSVTQNSTSVSQPKMHEENKVNINEFERNETFPNQMPYSYGYGPIAFTSGTKLGSKLATVDMDGIYLFILKVKSFQSNFNISVDIAMKSELGYLSAVDYPLLFFYGFMCGLYVMYAIAWLIMSALQWRDLLRIQFWIGAVILLGLMEKAVFYAEYQSINYTGHSVQGAILFAEILSCMKRTLARMLIIIVSLGFGIVKPRLGPMLHRIIGVGALYFCLGTIEGCLRVLKPKTDPGNQALMAGIPLAVTDSAICWWIFSSLVQTIRTLRLRRNIVKLQLYRHFTNALLLSVVASVAFMTWSIHAHRLANCITDWKELWVDEAYWHLLFSTILFVIMILWRPTNNNQRYAFTPLLDMGDDDDDDDDGEESTVTNDAFGIKIRTLKNNLNASPKQDESKPKQDEDLKWVEENIPTSLTDVAIPSLLDSDEEIMTAKFERSKME